MKPQGFDEMAGKHVYPAPLTFNDKSFDVEISKQKKALNALHRQPSPRDHPFNTPAAGLH